MATTTTNYSLKKPAATENYNVEDQNGNMDLLDAALTPTADPAQVPTGLSGKLVQWVSWITNRIKAITGKPNWYDAPSKSLEDVATHLAESTTDAHLPLNVGLGNVDNAKQMPIAGGTFTGIAKAQANTSYTVAQVRNIILSTGDANIGLMGNGDLWIKYE